MGWLTETGRVVAIESNAVWVEADRSSACGKCAARAGCGHGALAALLQQGKGRVRAVSGADLTVAQCELGDEVTICIPEATLLSGTLLIYGLPLLLATGAALLFAGRGDLASALAFCLGLLGSFAILRWVSTSAAMTLPGVTEPTLSAKQLPSSSGLLAKS